MRFFWIIPAVSASRSYQTMSIHTSTAESIYLSKLQIWVFFVNDLQNLKSCYMFRANVTYLSKSKETTPAKAWGSTRLSYAIEQWTR